LNFTNTENVVWFDTEDVVWTDTAYLTVLKYLIAVFGSKSPSATMNKKSPEAVFDSKVPAATMNKKSPEAVISSSKPSVMFEFQEV
jgi:hypothetical protein